MLKKAETIVPIILTVIFIIAVFVIFIDRRTEPDDPLPEQMYDFYIVDDKLNINTVNADILHAVLQIDERTCLQIVAYREKNGGFRDIRELLNVKGMTEEMFNEIAEGITVGDVK